ncbi:MAG: response regulator [Candidatus Methanoperedens sp.]|nr:response regulator [Candidatus Methanoperedens sp.]
MEENKTIFEILLVEDSPGYVRLMMETLKENSVPSNLSVVMDGMEALAFLQRKGDYIQAPRPDLILLDMNLPKMDGKEVLAEIKNDPDLKRIPVIILTTSSEDQDILKSYDMHVNCYITKPIDLDRFTAAVRSIADFWLTIVKLPPKELNPMTLY